ncbi:hypothetical protein CPJCM30710_26450 [Clostridium polyendosporum]|uniref:Uncharacterized protein n=1 Tax=Clostridium polyendosporum TaxID=69208 RepID=A0A919S173_9CLOT|nr:hypothetical protein [Clostridium polyendosporum]GIM29979.1 hypothetical protein CPJCM30710_26450 [Clostridium polyendosporum]
MKQFILVAGVDYEFKGVDFRVFCDNRMKRILLANRVKEEMTFKIFDFRRGEVVTHDITYPGGKQATKTTKLTPSPFKSISRANYDRSVSSSGETDYRFKDGQRNTMSILDIYNEVQHIGASAPGTLFELSFFSHSWIDGPILVNSYDDGIMYITVPPSTTPMPFVLPSGMRDPDDMDPRAAKDFISPTMNTTALNNFQKAFHGRGYIWIWGCTFPLPVHEILVKIEHHPSYKERGLTDDVVFKITNFNAAQADFLESWIKTELGGPFPDKKKIEIKFKFLKYFFCKVTRASYTYHIARNAKVKAYGGLMGTYSVYDSGSLPLMSVHKGFVRHFNFYKNYLGFAFDPEGRMYGEYKPGFTCTVPRP